MPRKRKYEEFFIYEANGSASCRIPGCSRPVIARSQSTGMPKHLKVHHPDKFLALQTGQIPTHSILVSSDESGQIGTSEQLVDDPQDDGGTVKEQGGVLRGGLEDVGGTDDSDPVPGAGDDAAQVDEHDESVGELGFHETDQAEYDSEQEWEVDAVLEKRITVEYLVKWKDYGESSNSWEPASNLTHCDELLEDFHGPHPPDNADDSQATSAAFSIHVDEEDAGLPDL